MNKTTILIVDDNKTFRQIVARFVRLLPEVEVVGFASDGSKGIAQAQALMPDVVLIDLNMPELPGLVAIPQLRRLLPKVGIIALTLTEPEIYQDAALFAGADRFVSKARMNTELLPMIREVVALHRQPPLTKTCAPHCAHEDL